MDRILAKYGMAIGGYEDRAARRDVIEGTIRPQERTAYDSTIELPDESGAIIPCVKTSYFEQKSDFVHLMPSPVTGEVEPCFRTHIEHEHANGLIIPCVSEHYDATGRSVLFRASVVHEHEEASYAVQDAAAGPDSAAPMVVDTRWAGDGSVSEVRVTIGREDLPVGIEVGGRRYVLQHGRMVEQEGGAAACS
jgi:hypothetical protein